LDGASFLDNLTVASLIVKKRIRNNNATEDERIKNIAPKVGRANFESNAFNPDSGLN